ncbi:HAD hydrolase-like protein [Massilia sp. B-10]|nr:HAD hydrolase-like protein [Massilia sp. B-10]
MLTLPPSWRACARPGYRIRFLTNASSVTRESIAATLREAGTEAAAADVFTAATTVAHYMRHCDTPRSLFYHRLGCAARRIAARWRQPDPRGRTGGRGHGRRQPRAGCWTATPSTSSPATAGFACLRPAATRFPNGERVDIGPGPTVELVESALGRAAHVLGKPNPYALTAVMGIPRGELAATLIIGDSLHQDIALANNSKRARSCWPRQVRPRATT